jgi:cyclopropane fatty-acyl-phospholipid synthase-like methyltransferase
MAMRLSLVAAVVLAGMPAYARAQPQFPEPGQVVAERAQAELDVPKLVDVLNLQPGMSVADVGAGYGAMSVVLAKCSRPTSASASSTCCASPCRRKGSRTSR